MIQGCRYLRRSTDRWILSKNSTTRLKDSKVGTGPVLLWNCSIPITNTKDLYLYPCPNTTPGRLRVQHSLPKLMSRRQCPFRTRHQFVPSLCPGHVITYSRKLPFLSANIPSAEWWRTTDRKYIYWILWGEFPAEWHFFTKLGPQVSPFPVPSFGVNICICIEGKDTGWQRRSSIQPCLHLTLCSLIYHSPTLSLTFLQIDLVSDSFGCDGTLLIMCCHVLGSW
jgi:hypothetical protein